MLKFARVVCLLGAGVLLAPALLAKIGEGPGAIRLSVQSCDTQCQTTETDCDLACDQVAACVDECKKTSEVCAQQCRDAPPSAKPDNSAKPAAPAGKKAPPAKGAPGKPPPKAKAKAA